MLHIRFSIFLVFFSFLTSFAQSVEWRDTAEPLNAKPAIHLKTYRTMWVDFEVLKSHLLQAPNEASIDLRQSDFIFSLPHPEGGLQDFLLVESSIMEPALQAKYPGIRTFSGRGLRDNKDATIRLDITLKGFHAQVLAAGDSYYIDPYSAGDLNTYVVYSRESFYSQNTKKIPSCEVIGESLLDRPSPSDNIKVDRDKNDGHFPKWAKVQSSNRATNGTQLRTYRLALACTGEYAQFHGGSTAQVMSAFTTSMNRVNGVFERDVSLRMVMVSNTDDLIYLNANTDPYTNTNGSSMLGQNQTTCNNVIGSSNYDIGHVFSTGGGGVAYLGSPCGSNKAGGVTGQSSPIGDPFDIDYVAHEMGHQWGANHTQNNSCNRSSGAAYEPGSASTIMGYAGICAPDLQNNSDAHFHNHSYNEMVNFTVNGSGNNCAVVSSTNNTPPSVTVPTGGFYIPLETPFELTGSASDSDGDALTYCWEQYDLGSATASSDNDLTNPSGNAPIFRSWTPNSSPTRVFPRISDLVNNTMVIGELLPTYARDLTFRCTVRDNAANGGGVTDAQVAFEATNSAGPFLVQAPNSSVSWLGNSSQTVNWAVANTNSAPVNCSNVDIFLSVDGGYTYPFTLLTNTPNDGSASVIIPNVNTSSARIKVKASNNIFFDISNQNFTIQLTSTNNYDLAFQEVIEPVGDVCATEINPIITIINLGQTTITSADILYNLNGASNAVFSWTGSLSTFEIATIALPTMAVNSGSNTLNIEVESPNGQTDEVSGNNTGNQSFTVNSISGLSLPFTNDFEGVFPGTGWSLVNPDNGITWESQNVSNDVNCNAGKAARIEFYSYTETGETDDFVSPLIDLAGAFEPELTFDYSYARYSNSYSDRMQVQILSGCGDNWLTLWDKENLDLATAGSKTSPHVPQCGEWSSESIDLSAYVGSVVQVRFRGISGYGNNLFIDNINVFSNAVVDCAGVPNGNASFDECGVCSGGTTGIIPNEYCTDCYGDINGNAFFDNCGNCVGGNTGEFACIDCGAGTYEFEGVCIPCPPGTYCPGDEMSYPCESGTYQSQTGAIECFDCPIGTVSVEGSEFCEFCPAGTYVNNGECTPCPPGTYCPGNGTSIPCAPGSYQGLTGQTECLLCDPGSFIGDAGATECELCPVGEFQAEAGAVECFDCPSGTISVEGSEFCEFCPAGTYVNNGECTPCPPGTYCPGNGTSIPCAPGSYQGLTGQTECLLCDPGSFIGDAGATECELCPVGEFQAEAGAVECFDCPSGTISVEGSEFCEFCPAGTYVNNGECTPCPPGTYCPGNGASIPCAPGSYQGLTGQTECLLCDPGSFIGDAGATECELCPVGEFQAEAGAVECFDCPSGTISVEGSEFCEFCPAGTYVNNGECTPCPPGTYCPGNGTSIPCAPGSYQGLTGQTECLLCDPGSFIGDAGATECELCPVGEFQAEAGAVECFDCPSGTISVEGSEFCEFCPAGTYVNNGECTPCPPGTYCPGNGTSIPCAPGSYQGLTGQTECLLCDPGSFIGDAGATECELCPVGEFQAEAGAVECFDCPSGTISVEGAVSCEAIGIGTIDGIIDWDAICGTRNVVIEVDNLDSPELNAIYNAVMDENGDFASPGIPVGTYNILITVEGHLSRLISNVSISEGHNEFTISPIIAGDLNGSNSVNVTDFSVIVSVFGTVDSDENFIKYADLNCDNVINVVDFSLLSANFGSIGDTLPE